MSKMAAGVAAAAVQMRLLRLLPAELRLGDPPTPHMSSSSLAQSNHRRENILRKRRKKKKRTQADHQAKRGRSEPASGFVRAPFAFSSFFFFFFLLP